jgi:hypothetical protein
MQRHERLVVLNTEQRGTVDGICRHTGAILLLLDGDAATTPFLAHELEYADLGSLDRRRMPRLPGPTRHRPGARGRAGCAS